MYYMCVCACVGVYIYTYIYTYIHIYANGIHNGILLSDQNNQVLSFATTWMELQGIMLSKISKSGKDRYMIFYSYVEFEKLTDEHRGREGKRR